MSRACPSQMKKLLDLLGEDGVLLNGRVVYSNTNYKNFWKRIALQLNAVEGGGYKSTWKWCKTWADWKNKTKKKADILLRRKSYNMLQTSPPLSDMELRLLKMINYPVDGLTNELGMVQVNKTEEFNTATDIQFLGENYNVLHSDEKILTDENNYSERCKTEFCDITDTLKYDNEECSSSPDKERVKIRGKVYKKRKVSLEEYKIKTTLEIEKERVRQKSEELRLRALELKLKGEELRLKEIEMHKINYLTNIEEEKLKYFKEISATLKESLERNGMHSLRFSSS